MPSFDNKKFGDQTVFHFSFKCIFCNCCISATVMAITAASTSGTSLALSTTSGVLVTVLTIVGVGVGVGVSVSVSVRHEDIRFVLYRSIRL